MEMISYPLQKQLSRLEKFTIITALGLYLPMSVFLVFIPNYGCLEDKILKPKQCDQIKGFFRISGIHVFIISFLYVIFSKAKSKISPHCIILGTVLSRTLFAGSVLYLLYIRQFITLLTFRKTMGVDILLSVASVVIWVFLPGNRQSEGFFKSIWQLFSPSTTSFHISSCVVHLLGYVQVILGFMSLVLPGAVAHVLKISPKLLDSLTMGNICLGFLEFTKIGFLHVMAGGADSRSFNIAAVFYRVLISIPGMLFIGLKKEVPTELVKYYIIIDAVFALAVFITLFFDTKKVKMG